VAILVTACLPALVAPPARADEKTAAQTFFSEARRLARAGRYQEACPKFEAAAGLFPGSGVLLNLGDCHEHVGKTATAWADFGEAAVAAERAGRSEDAAEARRRQSTLGPRLTRLRVSVAEGAADRSVRCDGRSLDRATWGTAFPVDPGDHVVEAGSFTTTVHATEPGATITVEIPAPPKSAPAVPATPFWTGRRTAGAALLGTGILSAGAGGILGLVARAQFQHAKDETGAARHDDSVIAVHQGNVATGLVVGGGALAVAGGILCLVAPKADVALSSDGRRVFLQGRF
jgi:hypothetical protein